MAFSKEIVSRKAKNDDEAIFDTEKKLFLQNGYFAKKLRLPFLLFFSFDAKSGSISTDG